MFRCSCFYITNHYHNLPDAPGLFGAPFRLVVFLGLLLAGRAVRNHGDHSVFGDGHGGGDVVDIAAG